MFLSVPPGGTVTLPHKLRFDGIAVVPDRVFINKATFEYVACDDTSLTVQNIGTSSDSCYVLCEWWHPIKRLFPTGVPGDRHATLDLRPFVEVGAEGAGGGGDGGLKRIATSFDYTSSGAIDFGALEPGDSIVTVQLVIDVPFDDPGTLISLGLASNPDGILSTANVDPLEAATYAAQENTFVTDVDALRLKIFPHASIQGAGRVVAIIA